jgi:hypothetical protein
MRKQIIYAGLLSTASSLFIFSCQKEINQKEKQQEFFSATNNTNGKNENRIYVSDINQLYAAVNDPANVGALVVLEPGTYILSASYPNSGRLELQQDMELQGQPGNPEQIVIDQSALPSTSFTIPPSSRTGGIRMGKGGNTIEWLTVKGNSNALSAIDTDLPSNVTHVRIANLIVSGGQIGIDIRNRLAEHGGRIIEAEIEHNEIVGNTAGFGTGIAIQNANGATGAIINTNLNGNYVHGNRVGLRAFNNAASSTVSNGSINIQSTADRFEENGLGMYLNGGISQASTAVATGNSLNFEVHGSSIRYNNPVPTPPEIQLVGQGIPGGIFAVGGNKTTSGNNASNNKLVLSFWGSEISDNNGDINVFGAFSSSSSIAGINNLAEINLYGISANAIVVAVPSIPQELAGTNIVNVYK